MNWMRFILLIFLGASCSSIGTVQQNCSQSDECQSDQICNDEGLCVLDIAPDPDPINDEQSDAGVAAAIIIDSGNDAPVMLDAGTLEIDAGTVEVVDSGPNCEPCDPGFLLAADCSCVDIDECSEDLDNCHLNATCQNTEGSFTCECHPGFEGDGTACVDIDGCSANPCFDGVVCTDVVAPATGYMCGTCPAGYEGDGEACTDIDGCSVNPCFEGVSCSDVAAPGEGYSCSACPTGYSGDGETCEDVDGCVSNPCYEGVVCTDVVAPGIGHICGSCPVGYQGNGENCVDIDGCAVNPCYDGVACTDVAAPGEGYICDACPDDPLKMDPGICGCGVADTNTDGDSAVDCNDACPYNEDFIENGPCGCMACQSQTVCEPVTGNDFTQVAGEDCNNDCSPHTVSGSSTNGEMVGPTLLGDGWYGYVQDYHWEDSACANTAAGVSGGDANGYAATSSEAAGCKAHVFQCLTLPAFDSSINQATLSFTYNLYEAFEQQYAKVVIGDVCNPAPVGDFTEDWMPYGSSSDLALDYLLPPTVGVSSQVSLDVTSELALLGGQEISIGFYLHDAWDGYGTSFFLFDEVKLDITGEGCTELPLCSETSEERCYTP